MIFSKLDLPEKLLILKEDRKEGKLTHHVEALQSWSKLENETHQIGCPNRTKSLGLKEGNCRSALSGQIHMNI